MVHKHDGLPSRKKRMPYTGRCYVLMTSSVVFHLPFILITGTSFSLTTTVLVKYCNGNLIFSITMPSSNISRAKPTPQLTFSADLLPGLVPFQGLFHILTMQYSPSQGELIIEWIKLLLLWSNMNPSSPTKSTGQRYVMTYVNLFRAPTCQNGCYTQGYSRFPFCFTFFKAHGTYRHRYYWLHRRRFWAQTYHRYHRHFNKIC